MSMHEIHRTRGHFSSAVVHAPNQEPLCVQCWLFFLQTDECVPFRKQAELAKWASLADQPDLHRAIAFLLRKGHSTQKSIAASFVQGWISLKAPDDTVVEDGYRVLSTWLCMDSMWINFLRACSLQIRLRDMHQLDGLLSLLSRLLDSCVLPDAVVRTSIVGELFDQIMACVHRLPKDTQVKGFFIAHRMSRDIGVDPFITMDRCRLVAKQIAIVVRGTCPHELLLNVLGLLREISQSDVCVKCILSELTEQDIMQTFRSFVFSSSETVQIVAVQLLSHVWERIQSLPSVWGDILDILFEMLRTSTELLKYSILRTFCLVSDHKALHERISYGIPVLHNAIQQSLQRGNESVIREAVIFVGLLLDAKQFSQEFAAILLMGLGAERAQTPDSDSRLIATQVACKFTSGLCAVGSDEETNTLHPLLDTSLASLRDWETEKESIYPQEQVSAVVELLGCMATIHGTSDAYREKLATVCDETIIPLFLSFALSPPQEMILGPFFKALAAIMRSAPNTLRSRFAEKLASSKFLRLSLEARHACVRMESRRDIVSFIRELLVQLNEADVPFQESDLESLPWTPEAFIPILLECNGDHLHEAILEILYQGYRLGDRLLGDGLLALALRGMLRSDSSPHGFKIHRLLYLYTHCIAHEPDPTTDRILVHKILQAEPMTTPCTPDVLVWMWDHQELFEMNKRQLRYAFATDVAWCNSMLPSLVTEGNQGAALLLSLVGGEATFCERIWDCIFECLKRNSKCSEAFLQHGIIDCVITALSCTTTNMTPLNTLSLCIRQQEGPPTIGRLSSALGIIVREQIEKITTSLGWKSHILDEESSLALLNFTNALLFQRNEASPLCTRLAVHLLRNTHGGANVHVAALLHLLLVFWSGNEVHLDGLDHERVMTFLTSSHVLLPDVARVFLSEIWIPSIFSPVPPHTNGLRSLGLCMMNEMARSCVQTARSPSVFLSQAVATFLKNGDSDIRSALHPWIVTTAEGLLVAAHQVGTMSEGLVHFLCAVFFIYPSAAARIVHFQDVELMLQSLEAASGIGFFLLCRLFKQMAKCRVIPPSLESALRRLVMDNEAKSPPRAVPSHSWFQTMLASFPNNRAIVIPPPLPVTPACLKQEATESELATLRSALSEILASNK